VLAVWATFGLALTTLATRRAVIAATTHAAAHARPIAASAATDEQIRTQVQLTPWRSPTPRPRDRAPPHRSKHRAGPLTPAALLRSVRFHARGPGDTAIRFDAPSRES
jgi:hypothetical protein